ncbi:tyrosine-type recombinase/integrase [Kordiimonas sp.]|uniref:tyrosine-type recombinase/integrase n=1 Tax=Kordiimonas sp. TaxID=1970157 RepID=UPI003A949D70
MAKLVKHSNGRWYIHYADPENGRSRELSTRTREARLAKERLAQFEANQARPSEHQIVISLILDRYLDDRKGRVASYDTLEYHTKKTREELGHYQPRFITKDVVRRYIADRRKDGLSDGTIIKQLKTLRAALALAVRETVIDKAPHIEVPPRPRPKSRWLTREEVSALMDATTSRHMKLFLMLAVYTGARKGAILDLTWDRVSDDLKLINFNLPGRPDSNKRRAIVPTTKVLQEMLAEARELAVTDHVIEFNGQPCKDVKTSWGKTLKRSGIDHCTIHDLRRTCATWLVQAGVPTAKVARMLGDSEKMIEQVYGHHSPAYLEDAVKALEG